MSLQTTVSIRTFTIILSLAVAPHALAQAPQAQAPPAAEARHSIVQPLSPSLPPTPRPKTPWYEKLNIRGYTQIRYNHLPSFDRNRNLINAQGDKSVGGENNFFIRRARVILYGDVHERLSVYLQPDFASSIAEQLNVLILRDWYADISLDEKKTFRIRVGQSKIPFGFENLQSSSNRLALDRNDALNSAVKDERDLGAFLYWAPSEIRSRFKHLTESGLKGSGDYGVVGLGAYNGQTANRPEANTNAHLVGRLAWPFLFGDQFVELNTFAHYGKYTVKLAQPTDGVVITSTDPDDTYADWRVGGAIVVYPQPLGFQAEWNAGRGPSLGEVQTTTIRERTLHGGYAQVMFKHDTPGGQAFIPFARATYYEGGKKFEANAPRYSVRELEAGVEWQPHAALELVLAYNVSDRTSDKYPYLMQQGHTTRIQLQFNY